MKIDLRRIVPFICAGALWFAAASCAENRDEAGNIADSTPTSGTTVSQGEKPDSTDNQDGGASGDSNVEVPNPSDFDKNDIKVFLENTSIPFGTESFLIKYEYVGEDEKNTCFGVEFELEKLVGGNWEKVAFSDNAAFIEIGLILGSDSRTHQSEVNLRNNFYKEPLTRGDYRVIKNVGGFTYTLDFSIV